MNIQILPNWCKKIGVVVFLLGTFLGGADDVLTGVKYGGIAAEHTPKESITYEESINELKEERITYFSDKYGEDTMRFLCALGLFGMLIYLMSREKVEDEFIRQLRLQSFQLSSFLLVLVGIVFYAFKGDWLLGLSSYIELFFLSYFIIFFVKKRFYINE